MLERIEQLIAMVLEKIEEVLRRLEEVSVGADVGVPATYTIDSEGNVKPIAGEEEEEEGSEEEEGGGGEKFPELPENLNEIFTVHDNLFFENDPDLSLFEWEPWTYIPPSGAKYLVVVACQHDRATSAVGEKNNLTCFLDGAAPTNTASSSYGTTGTGGTSKQIHIFIFKNPPSGKKVKFVMSGSSKSQTYIQAFPISVKGGINEVASDATGNLAVGGPSWSVAAEALLPSALVWAKGAVRTPEPPPGSKVWSNFKIFRGTTTSPIGAMKFGQWEVFLQLTPTGEYQFYGTYPAVTWGTPPTSGYGSSVRGRMNL